jgi:hypothetical protein
MYSMTCSKRYIPVTSTYNAPFSYGSNYTSYKRNRLLYKQYVAANPTKPVCNTVTPKARYASFALKQAIQSGCMNQQSYCVGCTKDGVQMTGLEKNSNVWVGVNPYNP